MGGRWNTLLKGSLVVLATLSVVSASSQIGFGTNSIIQRRLLSDLKQAQEAAGIFVDDAHLFTSPTIRNGRRLQQTVDDVTNTLANPTILSAILGLMSNGSSVGGFPGVSLGLPGGSNAGYSPTNNSYCIFSTSPRNESAAPTASIAGPPGGLPDAFSCVEGTTAGPNGFVVTYEGVSYACSSAPELPGSPLPGRKLLQSAAQSPALAALFNEQTANTVFENLLNAIGFPVWDCVVATTPEGNTTVGQATLAILNDLGVVAEHFLVYLNNDDLTYAQDIQNDFVSLANPLYPKGPRFNFSIDFESVAKDRELFREIFGSPAPPSPPPAPIAANVEAPATPTTGGTVANGTTPSNTAQTQSGGQSQSGDQSQSSQQNTQQATSQSTAGSPADTSTTTPPASPPSTDTPVPAATAEATLTVFDGYLSNCQYVLGSVAGGDGNFQRDNSFQGVIIDGQTAMGMNATSLYNGSASYIIPSSKAVEYAPLTQATRSTAQYCYDIATLQPVYNPFASIITANTSSMAGNAITTVAVFGNAYGATPQSIVQALGISLPEGVTLFTYNAMGQAINGSAVALDFMKSNSHVTNLVTSGANLLTNDSSVYASYAIIMNQAIARKISYSPPLTVSAPTPGRKLLQTTSTAAVDLTNATTVTDIIAIAQQIAASSGDATVRGALTPGLAQEDYVAVATAVANLNAATSAATDVTSTQLSQLYANSELATNVVGLASGQITPDDFATLTSKDSISQSLATQLPGNLLPTTPAEAATPNRTITPQTQSSSTRTSSSSSGLSHGGKVALATVFPIVGVIAIAALAAFFISRRNRQSESTSSTVWYRRPFARSNPTQTTV